MATSVPLARTRASKVGSAPVAHTRGRSSRGWTVISAAIVLLTAAYMLYTYMPTRQKQRVSPGNELKDRRQKFHIGRGRPPKTPAKDAKKPAKDAKQPNPPRLRAQPPTDPARALDECEPGDPNCFILFEDDPRFKCVTEGKCDGVQLADPAQPDEPALKHAKEVKDEEPRGKQDIDAQKQPPPEKQQQGQATSPGGVDARQDAGAQGAGSTTKQTTPSAIDEKPKPPPPAAPPRPARDPSWVPEQRPIPGEKDVTSHVFEELTIHSMNPPNPFSSYPAEVAAELASRLVLAVGMGVHSGNTNIERDGIISLPVFNTMMPSFVAVAQSNYIYRFYFAFDHNDPIYENPTWRQRIEDEFNQYVQDEDARRWHPPGYVPGVTIDSSSIVASLHWVHCNYEGKPAWAHSDAVIAAYKEGADYAYRPNDDTKFPTVPDWADRFIIDLRGRKPVANLGVVGPACGAGANWILTHDFTHKTHAVVFGYHYPRSLPNWSSDDWITYVYKFSDMLVKREDIPVEHMLHGQRYKADDRGQRLQALNAAIHEGGQILLNWAQTTHGVTLPRHEESINCC